MKQILLLWLFVALTQLALPTITLSQVSVSDTGVKSFGIAIGSSWRDAVRLYSSSMRISSMQFGSDAENGDSSSGWIEMQRIDTAPFSTFPKEVPPYLSLSALYLSFWRDTIYSIQAHVRKLDRADASSFVSREFRAVCEQIGSVLEGAARVLIESKIQTIYTWAHHKIVITAMDEAEPGDLALSRSRQLSVSVVDTTVLYVVPRRVGTIGAPPPARSRQ